MFLTTREGSRIWCSLCGFTLLGDSFVFLNVGPIFFLVFPLFWVLWFIYDWQGFITPGEWRVLQKDKILKGEEKVTLSSSSSLVGKNEVGDNIPRQHWIGSPPPPHTHIGFSRTLGLECSKKTSSLNPVMSPPT